jgi:hypothetical protein
MIKFFNKIRQNMIKENKVSKYLLYAIGEILLVVIGILIALSINNWNELRKQKAKETELLTYVLENIRTDSTSIDKVISNTIEIIQVHKDLVMTVNGEMNSEDLKNIDLIRRSEPNILITKTNNPNLANEVLNQNLKKKVLEYFLRIDRANFILKNHNAIIENEVRPFLAEKLLLNYGNQFDYVTDAIKLINSTKFFQELQKPELQQVLFESGIKLGHMNRAYNNLAIKNESLKEYIVQYISKK